MWQPSPCPQSQQWIKRAAQIAAKHNVKLVAYEAGQHLVGVGGGENNDVLVLNVNVTVTMTVNL